MKAGINCSYSNIKPFLLYMPLLLVLLSTFTAFDALAADEDEQYIPVDPSFRMSQAELELWNDASFKKQFIQRYIAASTEVVPSTTEDEKEQLQKYFEYNESNKKDKAAQLLEKAIARDDEGTSAIFHFLLGNTYFDRFNSTEISEEEKQQHLAKAEALYTRATEKYDKFLSAWGLLASIHINNEKYEKAIEALTNVIELGGYDGRTFGLLGYAYSKVNNSIPAESAYRMAILMEPNKLDWKIGLAQSFFMQERYHEVAAICKQLIKEQPDKTNLWLLQANAYIGMKEPLKAAEVYELLNVMGQSSDKTLNMLGNIYVNEELYNMAVSAYIKAMDKNPKGEPKAAMTAAKVLAARAALDETGRLIEHIELVYTDRLAVEQRKDLLKLRARIAVARGAGEEEFKVLEEIVALDPQDGEALILIGQYHERKDEVEMAINRYQQAANIEASEANAKLHHAQLLVKMAKYKESLGLLKSVIQLKTAAGKSVDNIQKYMDKVERLAKSR